MAFLTERLFQVLESHRIYESLCTQKALSLFMERHVICVWSYHALLKSIAEDLVSKSLPLNSDSLKESIRLISELILDEEVTELADGQYFSQLELYLESMQEMQCDLTSTLNFFDLLDRGLPAEKAIFQVDFDPEVTEYGIGTCKILKEPLHKKATAFFYEGEPFIPDRFLSILDAISSNNSVERLIDYFENHIEGLKQPGYSAGGRLVELICDNNFNNNCEAEKVAESTLRRRIQLWNSILARLDQQVDFVINKPTIERHLKLVQ